ncbi:DUF427 domain-containing protein [Vreelandella titanicae]|uniref:DUF427 domain-containing protein n=1 Tax=Vreelandella titanicae TaxID=664683 RepID=UPI0039BFD9B8
MDLLTTSKTTIHCPFKSSTVYFSLDVIRVIACNYEPPIEWMEAQAGRVAFCEDENK